MESFCKSNPPMPGPFLLLMFWLSLLGSDNRRFDIRTPVCQSLNNKQLQLGIVPIIVPVVYDPGPNDDGGNILGIILLNDAMALIRIIIITGDIQRHRLPNLFERSFCSRAFCASWRLDDYDLCGVFS